MEQYNTVCQIGQGACGNVYQVVHRETQRYRLSVLAFLLLQWLLIFTVSQCICVQPLEICRAREQWWKWVW